MKETPLHKQWLVKDLVLPVSVIVIAAAVIYLLQLQQGGPTAQVVEDSDLTNSPVILGSENVHVTYINGALGTGDSPRQLLHFTLDPLYSESTYDFFKVKIVLPNEQILFLPEVLHNQTYEILTLSENPVRYDISPEFAIKNDFNPEKVCFVVTFPDPKSIVINIRPGPSFDRNSCLKLISGEDQTPPSWR